VSAWGKILAPVVVPAGGWLWSWATGLDATNLATIPAGTYGTILSLAEALETELDKLAGSTVEISSTGIASVKSNYLTAVHWASCADALLSTLGYSEDETITLPDTTSATITATSRHRYGWYPGVLSHGAARGEGLAGDSAWQVADEVGRIVSGAGRMRALAPSRRRYTRTLRWAAIRRSEYEDQYRGPSLLEEHGATRSLRWYPDRADGVCDNQGTQGDPASSRSDAAGYYWLVTLTEPPAVEWSSQYPDLCSVQLVLNGEPA
jgi:hypothetical protein